MKTSNTARPSETPSDTSVTVQSIMVLRRHLVALTRECENVHNASDTSAVARRALLMVIDRLAVADDSMEYALTRALYA